MTGPVDLSSDIDARGAKRGRPVGRGVVNRPIGVCASTWCGGPRTGHEPDPTLDRLAT